MQQLTPDSPTAAGGSSLSAFAAQWTLFLVAFFFVTYALAAWISGLRLHVPSVVFAWESHIPFLPWMIVPYWSTDLLFVCSPFLFKSRPEVATHCKRLLAVQAISVLIFILCPLQFTFGRPQTTGLLGWMFLVRTGVDTQFNQAPSLHIGFAVVLWRAYSRKFGGSARWLIRGWIVLMSIATLTTFRHHFIDIPTGLWVGLFTLALFPDVGATGAERSPEPAKWLSRGKLYWAGAVLFSAVAYRVGNVSWLLIWPLLALGFVAYRRGKSAERSVFGVPPSGGVLVRAVSPESSSQR